ncbi:MAG TPA: hypothetical protein PLE45_09570 [Spirochaetota bacterium]|nr:hypothetical protein [Spirochaetota bacterium]HPP03536.1 hypothetical protein [Spirochaetota bacterium]
MKIRYFLIIILLFFSCKSKGDSNFKFLNNFSKEIKLIMNVEEKKEIALTRSVLNSRVLNLVSFYVYGINFKVDKKGNITTLQEENLSFEDYTLKDVIINTKAILNKEYYVEEAILKYNLKFDNKKYKNFKSYAYLIEKHGKDITLLFNEMITSAIKKINKKNIEGIIVPTGELIYKQDDNGWTLKEKFVIYYK